LNIGTKFIRAKKKCPALCPGCPQGKQGRAKKKVLPCRAGQGRASGRADSPALMTVSGSTFL